MSLLSLLTCGAGIVHEKLLDDYLHRIFSSTDRAPTAATSRYGQVDLPSSLCGTGPEAGDCIVGKEAGALGRLAWVPFLLCHSWL